jgi:hypothetical protein
MNFIKLHWNYRYEFLEWCQNKGCQPKICGWGCPWGGDLDIWSISDEEIYILAVLKWT